MRHKSIPNGLTHETLAQWIMQNRIETRIHSERIELDEAQIRELEHKSSMASRAIDKLTTQLKDISDYFKKGTQEAMPFTIYPTKGIDVLKANREFADKCLELGYTEERIELYGLPYPEKEQIIYVDVTGSEYDEYTEHMSDEQKKMFNTLFKEEETLEEQLHREQKAKAKDIMKPITDNYDVKVTGENEVTLTPKGEVNFDERAKKKKGNIHPTNGLELD